MGVAGREELSPGLELALEGMDDEFFDVGPTVAPGPIELATPPRAGLNLEEEETAGEVKRDEG